MKQRCYNKKLPQYKDYGGRGVAVCSEWLHDFMSFYGLAMANGYTDNLTIDRIDVNGNYEPNNCRWVTDKQQAQNRRSCKNITINNETHCIKEWCEILGLNYYTIIKRLKLHWTIEQALELEDR